MKGFGRVVFLFSRLVWSGARAPPVRYALIPASITTLRQKSIHAANMDARSFPCLRVREAPDTVKKAHGTETEISIFSHLRQPFFVAISPHTRSEPMASCAPRRGGRVVECTALEMRRTCKGTVGSNPTLSAIVASDSPSISPKALAFLANF